MLDAGRDELDMATAFQPIALPFNEDETTTRTALAQIGGTTLNDVHLRTSGPCFPCTPIFASPAIRPIFWVSPERWTNRLRSEAKSACCARMRRRAPIALHPHSMDFTA
ncbi:hypothetical protein [Breoghania sp.]|uniref:hypothetical protein n=1 Tax=Breoghania sp. TaxID=2065378 RepID=UPI00261784EC|nr:hypothetical protein [Breoghania sp.]MDJ0933682.1 hypothetical protein [Breoghania sp.]